MTVSNESTNFENSPLVSILINNYNYGRFIGEAIDSALNQTYPHTEVIVVDDGSTDNSREIIASYGNRIIPVLKENGGQASAFNVGFAASRGDIICFLDSDDVFLPEKSAEVVDAFAYHQHLGWCFHNLKWVDEKTEPLPKSSTQRSSRECDFRTLLKRGKLPPTLPATSALCFKRSLLQQILPMPEAKDVSLSDHYLKYTAVALSKGCFLGKILALHRIHGNNAASLRADKQQIIAKIFILTGYWIRVKFPFLAKFANKLVAVGIASYWRAGSVEMEYKEVINKYFNSIFMLEKLEINARALYYYLKG